MSTHSEYIEAENYILNIPKFAGKHTLADTGRLLEKLTGGNSKSRIIHVAGTNGKGSVCSFLREVLMAGGHSVGMFTSPHLVTMRERIMLGHDMIAEEDFAEAFQAVRRIVNKEQDAEQMHPSFFEYLFLMAMYYYQKTEPEFIILETGLGGRLDATNSVPKKEIAILTHMGMDHMAYLGDTLPEIAAEKAGIMQAGAPVVYWDDERNVSAVFAKKAENLQIAAYPVSKDDYAFLNFNNKSIDFSYRSLYYDSVRLCLSGIARYQMENAVLALRALEILLGCDGLSAEVMQSGIQAAFWAGRMEEILPNVYVDGAHNSDGIRAFLETVSQDGCQNERHLLFGVVQDKDYGYMIQELTESRLFADISVVQLKSERTVKTDRLVELFADGGQSIRCFDSVREAFAWLFSQRKERERIYIAGSLYLVGEIKEILCLHPNFQVAAGLE